MEQAMDALAAGAAGDWVEVFAQQVNAEMVAPDGVVSVRRHVNVDAADKPVTPCRCWRCRGGVAKADRPVLDRLLGAHLARQTPEAREAFMFGWMSNARHSGAALAQIEAWVRIALGSEEDEPTYEVTH